MFRAFAASGDFDLTVHYLSQQKPTHPWKGSLRDGFRSRIMNGRFGFDGESLRLALLRNDSVFVVAGWNEAPAIALLNALALSRRRFAIWTDTPVLRPRSLALRAVLRERWLSFVFSRATKVMSTGRPGVQALRAMGVPHGKIVDFPFFVDLERFSPSGVPPTETNVFLSVGRIFNSMKGHDLALRALALAREKVGAKAPIEYRIAGDGPDRKMVESLARELDFGVFKLVDWVESEDLPNFYRSGSVLLHPSRHDPFPVAILEAMACGLPVFGSDVSGSASDRVVDGKNGYIHRVGDVDALAEQIVWAIGHPEAVRKMGEESRIAAERWPFSTAIEKVRSLFETP